MSTLATSKKAKLDLPRVVELVRVSTDTQADKGTEELQRRALDALRRSRPCTLVERIEALGVSGAKGILDRRDLQRLSVLAAQKAFDELRVYAIDRLTRADDPRERFWLYGLVGDAGAVMVDCSGRVIDPNDESGMGELDYYLQTMFAARERQKIRARTMAGRMRKATDGGYQQGKPPYGRRYNHDLKEWVLVPEQAEVYRRILREALDGKTSRHIARDLNRDGVPARMGARWGKSSVLKLLKAPSALGEYRFSLDGQSFTVAIPPVIDKDTWLKVQASVAANHTKSGPPRSRRALLRGFIKCRACGSTAHVLTDGKVAASRYGCPKPSRREDKCPDRHTLSVAATDAGVRAKLQQVLMDSAAMLRAIKGVAMKPQADTAKAAKEARAELEKLDARLNRTLRLMDDGLLPEAKGREELASIRALRADAETRLSRTDLAPAAKPMSEQELVASARELGAAVATASDERWAELLRILCPPVGEHGVHIVAAGVEVVGLIPRRVGPGQPPPTSAHCGRRPQRPRART